MIEIQQHTRPVQPGHGSRHARLPIGGGKLEHLPHMALGLRIPRFGQRTVLNPLPPCRIGIAKYAAR